MSEDTKATPRRPKKWRPGFDKKAPKVWDPAKAERFRLYPQSAEEYEEMRIRNRERMAQTRAEGKLTRAGIPNGWSGRRAEVMAERQAAREEGEAFRLAWLGHNNPPPDDDPAAESVAALQTTPPADDEGRAAVALAALFAMFRDGTHKPSIRLKAAATFLEYTLGSPAPSDDAASTAEDFMAAVARRLGLPPVAPLSGA